MGTTSVNSIEELWKDENNVKNYQKKRIYLKYNTSKKIIQKVPYLPEGNKYMGFIPSAISSYHIYADNILNVFAEKQPDALIHHCS